MSNLVWLIPVCPLIGFLINGLFGRSFNEKTIGFIGSAAVGTSFIIALGIFFEILGMPPESRSIQTVMYSWILSGDLNIPFGFLVDPLSMIMMLVVSGVGCVIHVYSVGYMHGEIGFRRYFCLPESLRLQHVDIGFRQ